MRTAAIEQFLKAISKLKTASVDGAPLQAVAYATHVSLEQARQNVQFLVERGFVQIDGDETITLTSYGLRRLLTESIEDYLVTIYRLSQSKNNQRVATSAIAQALGVSAPSVTNMIKKS